jgi:hypothetical protein
MKWLNIGFYAALFSLTWITVSGDVEANQRFVLLCGWVIAGGEVGLIISKYRNANR